MSCLDPHCISAVEIQMHLTNTFKKEVTICLKKLTPLNACDMSNLLLRSSKVYKI